MSTVECRLETTAPMERVYGLLTDYERYPEFIPRLRSARVRSRSGEQAVAEFAANYVLDVRYVLAIDEEPPSALRWRQTEGFFRRNSGSWRLRPRADGGTSGVYTVTLDVGRLVPGFLLRRAMSREACGFMAVVARVAEGQS